MLEFIILAVFGQFAVVACLMHLCRFPDRVFRDVIPYLRPDHQRELEDLIDPMKEENLAAALGQKRFRREQVKRIHLAQECIAQRAHNARIFQEWGYTESERAIQNLNSDAGSRNAAALVHACLHYRVHVYMIQARLYAWYFRMTVLPFVRLPRISSLRKDNSFDLIDSYANVEQAAEHLASACGDECRYVLIRTLRNVHKGTADAAWISEAGTLRGGL